MNTKDNKTVERPPVIVIMGHIDHGKSALLDFIRKSNVVAGEAGGITQHTSAYEVEHTNKDGEKKKITFLDTPGHEAFSHMRARGAVVADIAILVVSAEDGVKTQTLEALHAIKDAGIPFVVAINKIDKPGADVERTKNSLMENEIYIEGYGGDIPAVSISAKTGEGVDTLLDMMLLVAELAELKADVSKNATGYIIEANVDPKKGVSATLVIKDGHLDRGMCVVAEKSVAPVRIFEDFMGVGIDHAEPSAPIRIVGWSSLPKVGALFESFEKKKDAEACAQAFVEDVIEADQQTDSNQSDNFIIPLILKADVSGTLDAVQYEIEKIHLERAAFKIISTGVGSITEGDVKMAVGNTHAIIVGFNVQKDSQATAAAEQHGIAIETFDIIYKMTEWLEAEAKKLTPETEVDEASGKLKVLKTFSQQKSLQVLGGKVIEGSIKTGQSFKIIRRENEIGTGSVLELQAQKMKTSEVKDGTECGLRVDSKIDIAEGDVLEPYTTVIK